VVVALLQWKRRACLKMRKESNELNHYWTWKGPVPHTGKVQCIQIQK
jgi:hypothetical protein